MSMASLSDIQDIGNTAAIGLAGLRWYKKHQLKTGEFDLIVEYITKNEDISIASIGASPTKLPPYLVESIKEVYKSLRDDLEELKKDEIPKQIIERAEHNLNVLRSSASGAVISVRNRP